MGIIRRWPFANGNDELWCVCLYMWLCNYIYAVFDQTKDSNNSSGKNMIIIFFDSVE